MKQAKSYLIIVSIFLAFLGIYHSKTISNIQHYFFGDYVDGIKNYYTPLYHISHDKQYSHFEGMNYPFGEQVVFTDNQPALSNFLKFLSNIFPSIEIYGVGILNSLMFLSILLCGIFVFKIFKFFNPNAGYQEATYSILLALLSPQIIRMAGHYALAYGFVIPLVWYLGVRHLRNSTFRNSSLIALVILFSSGLHFYYLLLSCGFLFVTYSIYYLFFLRKRPNRLELSHIFLQLILPVIILMTWISLTEHAELRPKSPHGFLEHTSYWEGIFLPIGMPLEPLVKKVVTIRQIPWEGLSYIGIFASSFALIYIFILLPLSIKNRTKPVVIENKQPILFASTLSALIFLVYSFGFPFIYKLEFLVDYIGPLKQFRGIGRFSWIFFYIFNVFAFVILVRYVKNKRWLLWIPCLILLYDASNFHKIKHFENNQIPEITTKEGRNSHWINKIDLKDIQAIMPIPYFHTGSEFLSIVPNSDIILKESMTASLISGMPMLAVQMSRTDMYQTIKNISLYLEPLSLPLLLEEFPNQKRFLLIIDKKVSLPKLAQDIINSATIIKETDALIIAKWNAFSYYQDIIKEEKRLIVNKIAKYGKSFLSDSTKFFVHKEYKFENEVSKTGLFNGFKGIQINKGWTILEQIKYPKQDSIKAKVSMWCYLKDDLLPDTRMIVEGRDQQGEILFWKDFGIKEHIKSFENGWALFEGEIEMFNELEYFFLLNNTKLKNEFKVYNFILQENGIDFFVEDSHRLWKNNRFYSILKEKRHY